MSPAGHPSAFGGALDNTKISYKRDHCEFGPGCLKPFNKRSRSWPPRWRPPAGTNAHGVFLPGAGKEASTCFLEEIVRPSPTAYHIIIQDQAGLHLRAGPDALPPRIHLLPLLSCRPGPLYGYWLCAGSQPNRHFCLSFWQFKGT